MKKIAISPLVVFVVFMAVSPANSIADDSVYFDSKFDGVWAGYLELEGMEFPLLLNFNSQGAASSGFIFFLTLGENEESFQFKPFPVNGIKVKKNKVKFEFDVLGQFIDILDFKANSYGCSLKYNKQNESFKGTFSFKDPDTKQKFKGSVLMFRMKTGKEIQGLWQGTFPKIFEMEDVPLFMFFTQNSPVGGSLLLMPKHTPFKNGTYENKRLKGIVDVTTDTGFSAPIEVDMQYGNGNLSGKFSYKVFKKSIGLGVKMGLAGSGGKQPSLTSLQPSSIKSGKAINIKIRGSNFASGALDHVDKSFATITGIKFVNSTTLSAELSALKSGKGKKIGLMVVNPDNKQAAKSGLVTVK